jgi:alkyl hydroperoxide reductase subunit AhpC
MWIAAVAILLAGAEPSTLKTGEPAPAFSLRTVNPDASGRKLIALKSHVGTGAEDPKKGVLLSFAASYCEPCKKELKELKAMEPELQKKGILPVVVVIDTEEAGQASMKKLLVDELAVPMPVVADRFSILARRYAAAKLPYVVLVDGQGIVRWMHAGYDQKALREAATMVTGAVAK